MSKTMEQQLKDFYYLTYDEKIELLATKLKDDHNLLAGTNDNEMNLKLILDSWRTLHVEHINYISSLITEIPEGQQEEKVNLQIIPNIKKIKNVNKNSTNNEDNTIDPENIISILKTTIEKNEKLSEKHQRKYKKNSTRIALLSNTIDTQKKIFSFILAEYKVCIEENLTPKETTAYLKEGQRLEIASLSLNAEKNILLLEQKKTSLQIVLEKELINISENYIEKIEQSENQKELLKTTQELLEKLSQIQNKYEQTFNLDEEKKNIYVESAILGRLACFRIKNAGYEVTPPMLDLKTGKINEESVVQLRSKISKEYLDNLTIIKGIIAQKLFKKPLKDLSKKQATLFENAFKLAADKIMKKSSGIKYVSTRKTNLELPSITNNEPMTEKSNIKFMLTTAIDQINDRISRLDLDILQFRHLTFSILRDIEMFSGMIEEPDHQGLQKLQQRGTDLATQFSELDFYVKGIITQLRENGKILLEELKSLPESNTNAATIQDKINKINNPILQIYDKTSKELNDNLKNYNKFVDDTMRFKEKLVDLGSKGGLK